MGGDGAWRRLHEGDSACARFLVATDMTLVILDGTDDEDAVSVRLRALAALRQLPVRHFALADMTLAPCLGDFECWTKTPGRCRTQDGAQDIAQAIHGASLVVLVSHLRFGGYAAHLKKGIDRLIGLVHPYFHARHGLTRHMPRYERYPPFLFLGITDRPYSEAAETFHDLAAGNAVNLLAPGFAARLITPADAAWPDQLADALSAALDGQVVAPVVRADRQAFLHACAADQRDPLPHNALRSAVVLIGSARPKGTSTSELLARRLIAELERAGVAVKVHYASQFIKAGRLAEQALHDMLAAEMLVVAAPLYVDGLPYLVVAALEQLAARLQASSSALRQVVGILNCGYPEAVHNRIAMHMLRNFAHQNHLAWAGGMALGGGEVLQGSLRRVAGLVARHAFQALQLAARSLACGGTVPEAATHMMARPLVFPPVFRWLAKLRWIMTARPHGVSRKQLAAQPWQERAERVIDGSRG